MSIPRLATRLELLQFKLQFDELVEDLEHVRRGDR